MFMFNLTWALRMICVREVFDVTQKSIIFFNYAITTGRWERYKADPEHILRLHSSALLNSSSRLPSTAHQAVVIKSLMKYQVQVKFFTTLHCYVPRGCRVLCTLWLPPLPVQDSFRNRAHLHPPLEMICLACALYNIGGQKLLCRQRPMTR